MKVISIEARTFEAMMERFEAFTKKVDSMYSTKQTDWLDNQEVCLILNISKRTLQTYRDNGTIPYSQINRKIYYKADDVKQVMEKLATK